MSSSSGYGAIEAQEEGGFQATISSKREDRQPSYLSSFKSVAPIAIATAVVGGLFISERSGFTNVLLHSAFSSSFSPHASDSIDFTFQRSGYDVLPYFLSTSNQILQYKFLEKYNGVIEPHAVNQLAISTSDSSVNRYKYTVCSTTSSSSSSTSSTCYSGEYYPQDSESSSGVSVPCSSFDEFSVEVTAYDSNGVVLTYTEGSAVCMYVRREIQSLTDEDLQSTMDTMYTLWSTPEEAGQTLYGDSYHDADYFTAAHDFNAAQPDADHIHEGLGFVPQHIKLSNWFESSLQAVNPSVSLPYWDFTIEEAQGITVYDSYVFTESTFGSINKPNNTLWGYSYRYDDMSKTAIPDGRWANIKASMNTKFPDLANAYGYMRGPWNLNPNPYISRFTINAPKLPSCTAYYTGLTMDDVFEFFAYAPFDPHAPIHGSVGGFWGCDKLDPLRESGLIDAKISQRTICAEWGFTIKDLYRSGYLKAKSGCTASSLTEEGIDCGFECDSDSLDNIANKLSVLIQGVRGKMDLTDDQWGQWRDFVCTGDGYKIFVGDHLESASTSDPSFWPMHPTLERLLQMKYLAGTMASFDWPTDTKDICDHFNCVEDGVKDKHEDCCNGHYESDGMLDFVTGDATKQIGPTNGQVLLDTDPTSDSYAMPYIYDNFKMDHCSEDFEGTVAALSARRRR